MSRRGILRATVVAGVGGFTADDVLSAVDPQTRPASRPTPFYYVDGYHGGIDGHMPASSLKNVLDGLQRVPTWKVSFEIEPYSWAAFAKSDPDSIKRLATHLQDKTAAARVELVSGAYGQCYAWNISGEANIRHLIYGARAIESVFPGVRVDTYAVQEPCWTNCLPGLLKSLGYQRAVLKNSTCWGGYHGPTIDADLIHWSGPDGTSLPAVPRYAGEGLIGPATIESSQPGAGFMEQSHKAGIENPAGTILQDMGWPGRPWRLGIAPDIANSMRHVTWREYVDTLASPPTKKWEASQEDLRVGLAWGATIVQRIAQNVRHAENLIIQAEKMASMAGLLRGSEYPREQLDRAWIDLMYCQHHDVWITPYNRKPAGSWAAEAERKHKKIEQACKKIIDAASGSRVEQTTQPTAGPIFVRVWNTTGNTRRDLIEIGMPAGADGWACVDENGKSAVTQIANDGRGNRTLLISVEAPAMGFATVQLKQDATGATSAPAGSFAGARVMGDGSTVIENDHHVLKIDPKRGGRISSLVHRSSGREFVDAQSARSFLEFRGYFGAEGRFLSSADAPATVTIEETGPLRATIRIEGHIGPYPFRTRLSMIKDSPRIDVRTMFDFPVNAPPFGRPTQPQTFRVGEPWPKGKDSTRSDRRPLYDSTYKLQALFPVAMKNPVLDKNAPFAVCRSGLKDTTFNSWATLQHNVILNWVDVSEADGSAGLAVMSDHTTAYSFKAGEPLGLVCCYAGPGTWFDYALGRTPEISYALIPHSGNWDKANLWRHQADWSEPLVSTVVPKPASDQKGHWSLAEVSDGNVQVTSLHQDNGQWLLRIFNASAAPTTTDLRLDPIIRKVEFVELDGRTVGEVPIVAGAAGKQSISVSLPQFAVRTLRLTRIA
ncbi:MAG TPA: glycoside hydrolase family 38 C-terminal domain-containing protein [Tepidisphaeraceae bacterium]